MALIQLHDTIPVSLAKMSQGNPGAITVMVEMLKHGDVIDPHNFMDGFGSIMYLDTLEIYGSHIWILYKDVCNKDVGMLIGLLRCAQMGIIDQGVVEELADGYREKNFNLASLIEQLKKELPSFDPTKRNT